MIKYRKMNKYNKTEQAGSMDKRTLSQTLKKVLGRKEAGIDGILVTVGLCIIALLLCVVMKDSLSGFITTIVNAMQAKAAEILAGV